MKKDIKGVTPEAMRKLMLHDWPGNIRELQNILEYAAAMAYEGVNTEISSSSRLMSRRPPHRRH